MFRVKEVQSNDDDPLFNKSNMYKHEFPSDYCRIRYFTLFIMESAPPEIRQTNLLEQQINEIIKNAVKHGNHCDPNKIITVWYSFTPDQAHIIVQDEGHGFTELERWNSFNRKRQECIKARKFCELSDYVSFRTAESDETDGGNALFAALEFWNGGLVFNSKRNAIAVLKKYPKNRTLFFT
jgi:hypothetical protein